MAAVAVRRSSAQKKTDSSRAKSGTKAHPRRRSRTAVRKLVKAVLLVLVLACLEITVRSSPQNVVAAAERHGMIYATVYDYLEKPRAVASAAEDQ